MLCCFGALVLWRCFGAVVGLPVKNILITGNICQWLQRPPGDTDDALKFDLLPGPVSGSSAAQQSQLEKVVGAWYFGAHAWWERKVKG